MLGKSTQLYQFLANHRADLITKCIEKVAKRPKRTATPQQLQNGIPMFIDQLTRTLTAEQNHEPGTSLHISGPSGGDAADLSEMGISAVAHGKALLHLGYSVDQVVHDYGDLCQAITDLAFEWDAPFSIDEYRTLNRCLDNAIANAVSAFSVQRDAAIRAEQAPHENEPIGFVMHELRNALDTASCAVTALERGSLSVTSATGSVLKRSHASMTRLISRNLSEVAAKGAISSNGKQQILSLASFIADAKTGANLDAASRDCRFIISDVDPSLGIHVNRDLLLAALMNLLHNTFQFTHPHTEVTLEAYALWESIQIEVKDNCGSLPPDNAEKMFTPFIERSADKTDSDFGLSIARKSIEADGGTLNVLDMPGSGCGFTIDLPRYSLR